MPFSLKKCHERPKFMTFLKHIGELMLLETNQSKSNERQMCVGRDGT